MQPLRLGQDENRRSTILARPQSEKVHRPAAPVVCPALTWSIGRQWLACGRLGCRDRGPGTLRTGGAQNLQEFRFELANLRQEFIPGAPGPANADAITFRHEAHAKLGTRGQKDSGSHVSTPSSSKSVL